MKKIAIIDNVKYNYENNEFNQISSNFINKHKDEYFFLVYCKKSTSDFYKTRIDLNANVKLIELPMFFRKTFIFLHSMLFADLLFINGLVLPYIIPIIKLVFKKKIILKYENSDESFSNKNSIKIHSYFLKEFFSVKYSDRVITCQESIKVYLENKYQISVKYIENGGSHVEKVESTSVDHIKYPFLKYMYAISYYNFEANKYIEYILDAFKETKNKYIVVIGNWDDNEISMSIKNKYSEFSNIYLLNTITNKRQKDLIYSNSILSIQPSPSITNNQFIIETMSLNLPVLAYDCISNKYLTEGKAAYFKNQQDVKKYIENISLEKMRTNAYSMYSIAVVRYNWNSIIKNYNNVVNHTLYPVNTYLISNKTTLPNISLSNMREKNFHVTKHL